MAVKRSSKKSMSKQHKAALATGRVEGRAVREYLDALRATRPKRGRRPTVQSIKQRLAVVDTELEDADPVRQLKLVQERIDLEAKLQEIENSPNIADAEAGFVTVARSFSERNGISYAAWREVGVEPAVLRKAGVQR